MLKNRHAMKKNVLFVCIHNSARSQMAEAWLNHLCGESFAAESAGLEPGKLNSFVVQAMEEIGIDISHHKTKSVDDMLKSGKSFAYVATVCDQEAAERCPIFPGKSVRIHWSFPDPSAVRGSDEEQLAKAREVRDAIKQQILNWCEEYCVEDVAAKC